MGSGSSVETNNKKESSYISKSFSDGDKLNDNDLTSPFEDSPFDAANDFMSNNIIMYRVM